MSGRARRGAVTGCLTTGDILLKYNDGSIVNRVISFGQWFGRGPSKFSHAGIASSATTIIEMGGHGLEEHNLLTDNAAVSYDAFRCKMQDVGAGACEAARMMRSGVGEGGAMKIDYTILGAARSISKGTPLVDNDTANTMLDKLLRDDPTNFFCSGFVVLCYQMALSQMAGQGLFPIQQANQVFSLTDSCYQPAYLWKILDQSKIAFDKIGKVKGAQLAA